MTRLDLNSIEQTQALGELFGRHAFPGSVLALVGELGAGKTAFTQGFARGLGIVAPVTSPTFVLLSLHERGRLPLAHADFYRLGDPDEIQALGLGDLMGRDCASLIEWADRFPQTIPTDHLILRFSFVPFESDRRVIDIQAQGPLHARLLQESVHDWLSRD